MEQQRILDQQQQQTSGMFLPCRFCTRMSLICPINSSRSNQSAQPRPAIWSRAESRRDPGRIAHKDPPGGGGGGGGGGGAVAAAARSGLLSSRSAWSLADTRADINGREPLHQPTWPLLERLPPGRRRGELGEVRRGRAERSRSTWLVFPRWAESEGWETPPPRALSLSPPPLLFSLSHPLSPSLPPSFISDHKVYFHANVHISWPTDI